ncbi:MAG: ATP-binding cassette domain-containing protein [Gallintestinimicrobium sp.]
MVQERQHVYQPFIRVICWKRGGDFIKRNRDQSVYKADLTKFFGVIHQDFHLFPMSVRDNIRAGEELSEKEIQSAVNQLEVRKKIRNLDQPISREFADDGLLLSGGESQQPMLARLLANRYPFVILDEPTSALDPLTERKINRYVMQSRWRRRSVHDFVYFTQIIYDAARGSYSGI